MLWVLLVTFMYSEAGVKLWVSLNSRPLKETSEETAYALMLNRDSRMVAVSIIEKR